MWSGLILLGSLIDLALSATIVGISTIKTQPNESSLKGSYRGGTDLYFRGDFADGNPEVYSVYVGGQKCPVVHFDTDDSNVHCIVPASSDDFPSQAAITFSSSVESVTFDTSLIPTFNYDYERTPWILYINPTEACPGDEVAFVGRWGTTSWTKVEEARIGTKVMSILDDETILDYWGWHNVTAVVNDNVHGDVNARILLNSGSGYSATTWLGFQYASNGDVYNFRTVAKIDSISNNEGSVAGGLDITIKGAGFPLDRTLFSIKADGANCVIKSVSYDKIVCTTTAVTDPSVADGSVVYAGGSGLKREFWNSNEAWATLLANGPDDEFHIATPQIKINEADNIKSRLISLFVPPITGDYSFYLSSDDGAQVFLSSDNTEANAQSIINFQSWTDLKNKFTRDDTYSDPIALTAGQKYYLEVRHQQGSGGSHFELGVEMPGSGPNKKPFIQHVKIGPTNLVREVQKIKIGGTALPTGGQLSLKYGTSTVDPVSWDAASSSWKCGDILGNLAKLKIGTFQCELVADSTSLSYYITFAFGRTSARKIFAVDMTKLSPAGTMATVTKTPGSLMVDGTFTVTYMGVTTKPISVATWIRAMERDINIQLPDLNSQLYLKGITGADGLDLYFMLPSELVSSTPALFTFDVTAVTGGALEGALVTNDITQTSEITSTPGNNVFYHVIPSEFLRTYELEPQVVVEIGGRPAVCRGDCSFVYKNPPIYPKVISMTSTSTSLTITGELFDANPSMTTVWIGYAKCAVTAISETSITCDLPLGSSSEVAVAGTWTPLVHIQNQGYVVSDSTATVDIPLVISSASPVSGSEEGGTVITISGTGFLNDLNNHDVIQTINIGNSPCNVLTTSPTSVTCMTTAKTSDSTITVNVGSVTETNSDFTYSSSSTPTVTSISATYGSTIVKTEITIVGTGFGTDQLKVNLELLGSETLDCLIFEISDTQIKCNINGGPRGVYTWSLWVDPVGFAVISVSTSFELKLEISSISQTSGSVNGGTLIVVTGYGFSSDAKQMTAMLGDQDNFCKIIANTSTSFTCITSRIGGKTVDTDYEFILYGRLVDRATCPASNCNFRWSASSTPSITELIPSKGKAGDSVTINGHNFGTTSSEIKVYFGEVLAEITGITQTSITVTVPYSQGTYLLVSLNVKSKGDATSSSEFTNNLNIESVSPKEISKGGDVIVISGSGFNDSLTFTFGTSACTVIEIDDNKVVCIAAAYSTDENVKLLTVVGLTTFTCADANVCGIYYLASKSLAMTSKSGNLIVAGTFPSVATSDVHVILIAASGNYECIVSAITTTAVTCSPNAPPGTYTVSIHVNNYGYATGSISYTLALTASSASATTSSFAGGNKLTVTGTGLYESTVVRVCGTQCHVTYSTGNSLECVLPPLYTSLSMSDFGLKNNQKLEYFTIISSTASGNTKPFDGDITTFYKDTTNTDDYIGVDVGAGWKFELKTVKFIGGGNKQANYKKLVGTVLQGSNDGTTWVDVKQFITINNFWNTWLVKPTDTFTYQKYRLFKAAADVNWSINGLEFYGIRYKDSSLPTESCSVTVASSPSSSELSATGTISYSSANTAKLSSISPKLGTSAGGTVLTLTGSGFGSTTGDVSVLIDNISCSVTSVSDSSITCTTGARPNYTVKSLTITLNGKGFVSTQGILYTYAERWSDFNTWGGEVPPREGESVYVPPGMNLIIDQATPILNAVLVEGSLIVEDVPGITIDAHYIFMYGGSFTIGTEDEPFLNDILITMHGDRQSPSLPSYGNKFIAVRNGVLDIHGKPREFTWTLLDQTANAGDSFIILQDEVDWVPGDKLVLATTSYELEESEIVFIDHIDSSNPKKVHLTEPLKFQHYAATETYGTDTIEIRGEVGLLTRNIKIRGSDQGLDQQHGVHIMLFSPGDESAIGRIEHLELFYAGQAFSLGRYPLHFHMIGNVTQSYIRNNAIYYTFNRATTVHGVHYLTIKNNVAYHTMGHTYFIEDGIETQNTFEHNLGINTYQSFSLLNLDQTPAIFWITNPSNYILNNHAAGGMAYGFWYSMDEHPSGPSATSLVWPEFMELGQFQDNTAHSVKKYGLRIFHKFFPSVSPGSPIDDKTKRDWWDVPNVPIPAEFHRLTAWKCSRDGAIAEDVGDVRFIDFKVADNIFAGIELTYTNWTKWYETTRVVNALVIGNSGNTEGACAGTVGLLTSQTDGLFIDGAKFFNFDDTMNPIGDESHSFKPPTRDQGARLVKMQKISFTNSHKRVKWGIPLTGFFELLDATFTGQVGFMAAYWTHLLTPECTDRLTTFNSIVCDNTVKIRRISFFNQSPFDIFNALVVNVMRVSGNDIQTQTVTNADGSTSVVPSKSRIEMQKGGKNHHDPAKSWNVPFVTGYEYQVFWGNSPIDWMTLNIEQDLFDGPEWVHLKLNFTDHRENFVVSRGVLPAGVSTSDPGFVDTRLASFKSTGLLGTHPSGTYTWNNASGTEMFEMIVNGVQASDYQWGNIAVTAYRCFGTHCSTVSQTDDTNVAKTEKYWSDLSIWAGGVFPVAGSYVEIPSSWHLYLDIDTPILQQIDVNGILEFSPNKSATLNAHWVFIRKGELRSGSDSNPTKKDITHKVVLYGEPLDDSFAFSPDVQGGNKVIVVTGNFSMHGYPKVSFSQLEQSVYPGSDIIFVTGVDWEVGDEIAISPSGYSQNEYEVFTITEISGKIADYDELAAGTTVTAVDFASDSDWIAANNKRQYGKDQTKLDDTQQSSTAPSTGITKIKLSAPVDFYHSGAPLTINGYLADMRTEVALISRNVQIVTEGNGWGFSVVVNDFLDELVDSGPVMRYGNTDLEHVAFKDCGQLDSNLACIRYQSTGTKSSSISDCSFKDPQTWAIYLDKAKNINIESNVILNARWRGVVGLAINDVTFKNNVVIHVFERGYTQSILDAAAGFHICTYDSPLCTFNMIDNKVLGFDFGGFMMSAGECGKTDKFSSGNKVRSGKMGFLYTSNGLFDCTEITSSVAHFCEEGLGFKSPSTQYYLSNFEFIENLVGMSVRSERHHNDVSIHVELSDSIFIGKTIHSLCQDCASDRDCSNRTGYVYGLDDAGGFEITLTAKIKYPLNSQRANSNVLGMQYVNNIEFMNFNSNPKCTGRQDYAISSNPHSPDYQLPQTFTKIKFTNVNSENLIYMHDPDPKWLNEEDCVDWNCTGPLNAIGFDLDGSIVGGSGGYILPNNPGVAKADICKLHTRENAYLCVPDSAETERYMMLIFESMDEDKSTRTFAPINITSYGDGFVSKFGKMFRNDIAEFQDHVWDGFYTGHIRLSRFPSIIYSGQYYNITSTGTLPNSLMFYLQATDELHPIIVAIKWADPAAVNVYLDGTLIQPYKWTSAGISECKFSDNHGTNRWFHEQNTLQFVMKTTQQLYIKKSDSIKISLELDIPVSDFFKNDGVSSFLDKFAAMLNIPSYRIRIVNIRSGSTIIDYYVVADDTLSSSASEAELNSLNDDITQAASDGTLGSTLGYTVLAYSSKVETISDTADSGGDDSSESSSEGGDDSNNESNDDSTTTTDPNGENKGSGKSASNSFKVVAEDWLVAIFGGIIFILILLSGLVLYTKNANKSVTLQEMNRQFTSKVGVENPLADRGVWMPDASINEESKSPV